MGKENKEEKCQKCGDFEREHFQNPLDLEIICNRWGCPCSREIKKTST